MIKGIDAQVITHRVTEYSKDASAALRRDDVANEFADRLNKLNAQQETKTVSQLEKAEHSRVNVDQERGSGQQGQPNKQGAAGQGTQADSDLVLPAIGARNEARLLDIEI